MDVLKRMGACLFLLLIAVIFDIIGLIVLFVGIFANLRLDGQFYGDFLIYTGSLVVFLSLFFWLMWYVGNIQVPDRYFNPYDKNSVVERLARSMSRKMSQKPGTAKRINRAENDDTAIKTPVHKASRVTWGKNSAFHNESFYGDDGCKDYEGESVDSPTLEKKLATMDSKMEDRDLPPNQAVDE